MKVKEESEKVGLKLNIQKTKIKASGPITSWQIPRSALESRRVSLGAHRVEFGEVSGHRVLIKSGPGNRGPTECGTTHEATSGMSS